MGSFCRQGLGAPSRSGRAGMGCPPAGRRTVFPAAQPPRWHPSTTPAPPRWTFVNHGAFGAALRPAFEEAAAWRALCEAQPLSFLDRSLLPQLVRVARQLAAFLSCSPPDLALMPSCTSALNTVLASARVRCALLCCCCAVRCCAVCAVRVFCGMCVASCECGSTHIAVPHVKYPHCSTHTCSTAGAVPTREVLDEEVEQARLAVADLQVE